MASSRSFACGNCESIFASESGLRSHYTSVHQATYHRNGLPTTLPANASERMSREKRRRMNSRQRHRHRAIEAAMEDLEDVSSSIRLLCQHIADDTVTHTAVDEFLEGWNVPTSSPQQSRRRQRDVATQTKVSRSDKQSMAEPDVFHQSCQVGNPYHLGPEYPPGQNSFWLIALYVKNNPGLSAAQLTHKIIQESSDPTLAGPDRRRLYGYVCTAVAAEQVLVEGILETMKAALSEDPTGQQSLIQARAIIADRATRPVSKTTLKIGPRSRRSISDPYTDC